MNTQLQHDDFTLPHWRFPFRSSDVRSKIVTCVVYDGRCYRCAEILVDYYQLFEGANPRRTALKVDIDHVIPASKGGKDSLFNYALSCSRCNRSRQAADPTPFELKTAQRHWKYMLDNLSIINGWVKSASVETLRFPNSSNIFMSVDAVVCPLHGWHIKDSYMLSVCSAFEFARQTSNSLQPHARLEWSASFGQKARSILDVLQSKSYVLSNPDVLIDFSRRLCGQGHKALEQALNFDDYATWKSFKDDGSARKTIFPTVTVALSETSATTISRAVKNRQSTAEAREYEAHSGVAWPGLFRAFVAKGWPLFIAYDAADLISQVSRKRACVRALGKLPALPLNETEILRTLHAHSSKLAPRQPKALEPHGGASLSRLDPF